MLRRSFLKAGAAGLMLPLAAGISRARDLRSATQAVGKSADPGVVVISVDGSVPSSSVVEKYRSSGADVWVYDGPRTLPGYSRTLEFLDDNSSTIALARTIPEILSAKRAGKVAMVLGWQNSSALEEEEGNEWRDSLPPQTNLRAWYELGLRIANLQYNLANQFGGGCLDPKVPLTVQGTYLVRQMQDMGILVDCGGHTGEQTSLDIIRIARRPVVCTHSNVLALNDNPRNTSDRVIDGIAKSGGVFGVTAMDCFMTWSRKDAPRAVTGPFPPRATVSRYVDEFDYLKRLVGIDHIGLGPDFINDVETIDTANSIEFPPEMTHNQFPTLQLIEGFESVSDIGNVRAEMERRGYTADEIAKVFGGNWMRVYGEAWNG